MSRAKLSKAEKYVARHNIYPPYLAQLHGL